MDKIPSCLVARSDSKASTFADMPDLLKSSSREELGLRESRRLVKNFHPIRIVRVIYMVNRWAPSD